MTEIKCLKYKVLNKGFLEAVCEISIFPVGLLIRGLKVFSKDGRKWLGFPALKYEKDGATAYWPYLLLEDKDKNEAFTKKVLSAIDDFLKAQPAPDWSFEPTPASTFKDEELPF